MHIYSGDYLTINFEKDSNRFVQFWVKSPENIDDFKREMLIFLEFVKEYRPTQTLWLQENFSLVLTEGTQQWIEENINLPAAKIGGNTIAFVVSKDLLVHMRVIEGFEEIESVIDPKHFASEKEARDWLDHKQIDSSLKSEMKVVFEGVDDSGNSVIKINSPSSDITNTIKSFRNFMEESSFVKSNVTRYSLLTKREKEILNMVGKELKHQVIADKLHLSLFTIRTHWRNIKKKLEIKTHSDVSKYVTAFGDK